MGRFHCFHMKTERPLSKAEETEKLNTSTEKDAFSSGQGNRPVWDKRIEFLLAAIGFAVGFGNIWRFPWLLIKNGGGAFLIPYFIMLILEGIPLFILELFMGQKHHLAPLQLWRKISTVSSGLGLAQAIRSMITQIMFLILLSWSFFYFFASFQSPLPWSSCERAETNPLILDNNQTLCNNIGVTVYYWYEQVVQVSDSFGSDLSINWKMSLCIVATGIVLTLCLIKGIRSTGKVVYFTVTFPYLVLFIFLIRGLTLRGSEDGLKFLFRVDFKRLGDPYVWFQAAGQVFFSLSLAGGGMITYSSYNPTKQDLITDALTISTINSATSFIAGLSVFSLLGHRAYLITEKCKVTRSEVLGQISEMVNHTLYTKYNLTSMNTSTYKDLEMRVWSNVSDGFNIPICGVNRVLQNTPAGTGLAFISMNEVINQLPGATVFSILFFLMLITVGMDSFFGAAEFVMSCVLDAKRFKWLRHEVVVVVYLTCLTLVAQIMATKSGEYFVQLLNTYVVDILMISFALIEILTVMYTYGGERFCDEVREMSGKPIPRATKYIFLFISPAILLFVLVASTVNHAKGGLGTYQRWDRLEGKLTTVPYPPGGAALGWLILLLVVFALIGVPIYTYLSRKRRSQSEMIMEEKPPNP